MEMTRLVALFIWSLVVGTCAQQRRPNILFLLVDDLGYNDVGYHNCTIKTPFIDQLASEGIILENNYVANACSPSRASLLTGRYSFHVGYQNSNPLPSAPVCLTKENPLLPEALKAMGYNTYMVGKWSMGFCNEDCTPTHRGFDKFYGFYNLAEDHYSHLSNGFYDFRNNSEADTCSYGQYSADLFATRAEEYIDSHVADDQTKDNPFFMYFAFYNVHSPLQAPEEYLQKHLDEPVLSRRLTKAMLSVTDDKIRSLVQKLKDHDLYDNTIIIFSSDNGGEPPASMNAPLRGAKGTVWEGGVRVPGFVHSPLLKASAGTVSQGLFHQTDWFPTIMSLTGALAPSFVDGFDQTELIINGEASVRSVIPIHYDHHDLPLLGRAAIRAGKWKMVKGFAGHRDGYDSISSGPGAMNEFSPTGRPEDIDPQLIERFENRTLLFDLEVDPSETTDLAGVYPEVVQELEELLQGYAETAVDMDPRFVQSSPDADPQRYGGIWSPGWC